MAAPHLRMPFGDTSVMTAKLRVALVCLLPGAGGVEHHVADLAEVLHRAAEVVVVTVDGGWLAASARARGLRVATIPECRGNFDLRTLRILRQALRRLQPDVVHSHLGRSDWYAWLATMGGRVLLVSTEHGISEDHPELYGGRAAQATHQLAHRLRLRRTDAVIAVSQYTARALMARYRVLRRRPPLVVLPSVDAESLERARHDDQMPDGTLRLVCLSRLSHEKGVDVLLRALATTIAQGTAVHATIAGDGEDRGKLGTLAEALGLQAHVDFLGRIDDVVPVLRQADALVIPSRSENLPLAALEALAAGVPVVATDVGGVGEVVVPGSTGWLVPSEDTGAFAAVFSTLADGVALRTLRSRSSVTGRQFGVSRMVLGVLRAYELGNSR